MNNKKLFKGALVLFASILMTVSCSNNSTGSGNDGNGSGNGGGNQQEQQVVTLTVAVLKEALGSIGKIGDKTDIGEYDFNAFWAEKTIASGKPNPDSDLQATAGANNASKAKTKALMEGAFIEKLNASGFNVNVDATAISSASASASANVVLTLTPLAETKEKKYVFSSELTKALAEGKLTIKIKPTDSKTWTD